MLNNWKETESEYEGKITKEWQTSAKLISIGNTELSNTNGNKYKINIIEVDMPTGKKQFTAMCYERNYKPELRKNFLKGDDKPMEEGKPYLTTMRLDQTGTPQLQVSHLTNGNRAQATDFDFLVRAEDGSLELATANGAPVETEA